MSTNAPTDPPENLGGTVFVRLRPETEALVRQVAEEEDRPLSTTMRRLVEEALAVRMAQKATGRKASVA